MDTILALVLLLAPLLGFLLNTFFGKQLGKTLAGTIGTLTVLVSFAITLYFFLNILETNQPLQVQFFDWIAISNFKVEFGFLLDQLSLLWLLFVTGIGALIHIYSISYMHDDDKMHTFFAYLNLFVFFMMSLVMGSNLLIMFIGWEGVGLCSYLLIGFWYTNQDFNDAAKKAFIMNRIGDLGLLVGIFIVGFLFNTIDFAELKTIVLAGGFEDQMTVISIAALALFIGAAGKSAQIPLYTWLPDAMAGPTPVSALIHAATMVTAGIFMITRLHFLFDLAPIVQNAIAIIGAITALVAATIALVQTDIKKVLAYSTVSQLGLMFLALGLGAYEIAVFHVITHAFFKACLFLGSGSVIHALHEQDMRKMGGLRKAMPITFITMLLSSLAISGIFPLAGFWSKDEILMTAFHESPVLWVIGSIASIFTAFYMFRLMFLTFFNDFRGTDSQKSHLHESPALITFPLIVLAILATIGGLISLPGNSWLNHYLMPFFAKEGHEAHVLGLTEYILMGIATVGALVGIAIAYAKYIKQNQVPGEDATFTGINKVLYNKYYLDEIYDSVFVKPINGLANFFRDYVETGLSAVVFGFGKVANELSFQGKKLHNGSIGFYLFVFVIGFCAIISYLFIEL
jgi:NADH-quinone oxidoreductase subunit L